MDAKKSFSFAYGIQRFGGVFDVEGDVGGFQGNSVEGRHHEAERDRFV